MPRLRMQKFACALLSCLLPVLGGCDLLWSESFADRCDRVLPPTSVEVAVSTEQVVVDNTHSVQGISQMPPVASAGSAWSFKLGLTSTELASEVSVSSSFLTAPSGETCMRPAIKVSISASPQRVYVAREFPAGTCAYTHIVEHEMRHVRENQAQVVSVATWLKGELTAHFGGKIYRGDQAEMEQQMAAAIREQWIPMAQQALANVEVAHRAIDTPEEYARNHTVCDGAIPAALGARFGLPAN